MKKRNVKKLVLAKETVRGLEQTELGGVAGGEQTTYDLPCPQKLKPPPATMGCN
jgi:hypothetical protein